MKIYIVRHGQTTSNSLRCHSYESDELTEVGIKQAEELREKIKDMKFDAIICSPLIRAKHTAEIITYNSQMIFDERIKERDPGNLSGVSHADEDRDDYWDYYSENRHGTAESAKELIVRVYDFLDELKLKEYKSVLIVAHSGVSKAFSVYFEGIQDGKLLHRGLKNCEIKEYEL